MTILTGGVEKNIYIPPSQPLNPPPPRKVPISPTHRYVPPTPVPSYGLFPVAPHVGNLTPRNPNYAIPSVPQDWLSSDPGNRPTSIFREPLLQKIKPDAQLDAEQEEIRINSKPGNTFPWWLLLAGGGILVYYYYKKG